MFVVLLATASPAAITQELPADSAAPAVAAPLPDPEVAAARVSKSLKEAQGVPARGITVVTHASTIVLTGEVDTEAQRVAALTAAEKAAGGVRISNNLQVRAVEDLPLKQQQAMAQSAALVRNVEAALKADARTGSFGITVSSTDPESIVLQGLVPSKDDRTAAGRVALRVKGVNRVENRLLTPDP